MEKEKIHLADIKRILLGEAPVAFLGEVFVRSIISYIVMLIIVKMLGKRMGGRLTPTEMAVMLMFGAIISGSMQIPERGIIEAGFVLLLVVLFQRLITLWTVKSCAAEDLLLGKMNIMVKDGVMQIGQLASENVSRNQLFGLLRSKQVQQLGEIKRLYMETSGSFSLFKEKQSLPGLSVLPEEDLSLYNSQEKEAGKKVCYDCGTLYNQDRLPAACDTCHGIFFVDAVKSTS